MTTATRRNPAERQAADWLAYYAGILDDYALEVRPQPANDGAYYEYPPSDWLDAHIEYSYWLTVSKQLQLRRSAWAAEKTYPQTGMTLPGGAA